jgi:capsid protein
MALVNVSKKSSARASKRKITPSLQAKFADLPRDTQKRIAATIIGGMRKMGYFARGGYRTVHGPDQLNRSRISAETEGEVGQLTIFERNRLVSLARNAARNSDRLEGILHQIDINVVGVDGGKAVFEFPKGYEKAAAKIETAFVNWAQEAEYFEDLDLQDILKLALRTQMLGGDVVLVFDDDITAASTGQVIAFEPDCVGDLVDFKSKFPGFRQYQGIVKNANGKTVGVTVSWSQRGLSAYDEFDANGNRAAWTLIKSEGQRWRDSLFTIFRGVGRFNQIRGSSRLWPGLGTVADLTDLQGFEVQAAKMGAQKIGQILQDVEKNEADISAELDPDAEAPIGSDDYQAAVEAAQEAAEEAEQIKLETEEISGAGVLFDLMPPGLKMELLDTKHPNDKLVEFSNWLHRGVGFALGLGSIHATGKADNSYSASQAEMVLAQLEFDDEFHKLEKNILDWVLVNWSRWAQRRGLIPQDSALPLDWRRTCVKWQRPPHRSLDPVKEQTALNSGLKNGTILYRERWGANWKQKALAFGEEIESFKANGIPHLALQTVSGNEIVIDDDNKNADDGEEGKN